LIQMSKFDADFIALLKKLELNSSKESIKRQSSSVNNNNLYILGALYRY
jgi:hypothetical protein